MRAGRYLRYLLVLMVWLPACWRDGPGPAPPPAPPVPVAEAEADRPKSRWRPSQAVAHKPPPDPTRTREEIAKDLQATVRTNAQVLQSYVAGPIVVLDLDAGTLTTECDASALNGAQQWGQLLADPKRPTPHCRGAHAYTCTQFATQQILIVEFDEPDQWRIVSVIVGNYRNGRATMNAKIGQMRAQIGSAACP